MVRRNRHHRIALNAGNLDIAANRITGHGKVMLQCFFSCIAADIISPKLKYLFFFKGVRLLFQFPAFFAKRFFYFDYCFFCIYRV